LQNPGPRKKKSKFVDVGKNLEGLWWSGTKFARFAKSETGIGMREGFVRGSRIGRGEKKKKGSRPNAQTIANVEKKQKKRALGP